MRFLSVCSGIEAASVAWNPLGWKAAAFAEIEPFPCSVLAHHYPSVPNWGDMTKYQEWPDVAIDLLCGGTPCQSFSVAGLRAGLADPRGNLMLTYGAIAAKYRPRWLVWENVPGVLSSNAGRDFGSFLGLLGQLGYGFAYRVLDAQYFGVPQRRRRVFVVGCLGDWRSAAAVLFERHSLSGHPAPSRQARERPAPTLSARTKGGGGLGTDFDCDGGLIQVTPALNATYGEQTGQDFMNGLTVPVAYAATDYESGAFDQVDAASPLTTSADRTRAAPVVAWSIMPQNSGKDYKARRVEVLQPLMAGAGQYGNQGGDIIQASSQVRRLTPLECERLQGFPDDYTNVPHRGKPAADGPRYKALGNSWAVPCARWIGQRIDAVRAIHELKEAA